MDIYEEPSIRSRVYDVHNPRIEEFHQVLAKINKILHDCREDFFSMHPRRPVEVAKVLGAETPSAEIEEVEFADEVLNPIELGTSLFYEEDLARRFTMHLCSPLDSDRMWGQFGVRIDTVRAGFRTRFEVGSMSQRSGNFQVKRVVRLKVRDI